MGQIAPAEKEVPDVVHGERRRQADRREHWRGGRRDSDWANRPANALAGGAEPKRNSWRGWIQSFLKWSG